MDGQQEVLQGLAQIHTESARDGMQLQVLLIPQRLPDLLYCQVGGTLGPGIVISLLLMLPTGPSFLWEMQEASNRALYLSQLPLSMVHNGKDI